MVAVVPVLYIFWKIVGRTRIHRSHEVDLMTYQSEIEEYTRTFVPTPPKYVLTASPTRQTYIRSESQQQETVC